MFALALPALPLLYIHVSMYLDTRLQADASRIVTSLLYLEPWLGFARFRRRRDGMLAGVAVAACLRLYQCGLCWMDAPLTRLVSVCGWAVSR